MAATGSLQRHPSVGPVPSVSLTSRGLNRPALLGPPGHPPIWPTFTADTAQPSATWSGPPTAPPAGASSHPSSFTSPIVVPIADAVGVLCAPTTDPGHHSEGREGPTPPFRMRYPVPPLPNFSGEGSVEDFLARFRNHAAHCQWNEEERSFYLRNCLQGVAAQVLWRLSDTAKSDEVLARLQTRFGQVHQEQRFRAELKARRRRPGESVQSLANDLYYLAERGYPKERDDEAWGDIMKDMFITALNDPKLRMEVLMRQPKTMDEAADVAAQIEAFQTVAQIDVVNSAGENPSMQRRRGDATQVRVVQQPASGSHPSADAILTGLLQRMEKALAGLDERINSGVQKALSTRDQAAATTIASAPKSTTADRPNRPKKSTSAPPQSNRGARGGKRSSDRRPPQPKYHTCYNCGSTDGHWARDCPHPKKTDAPARSSANQTRDVRRPSAVYAKAVIYKRTVPVLFDSGCDRSVVHARLLPADVLLRPTTEKLFTADNTELPLLGATVINFTINGARFVADVVVSPAIEGLFLGVDWMKKNKAVMNFDEETIAVEGKSIHLHARPDAVSTR